LGKTNTKFHLYILIKSIHHNTLTSEIESTNEFFFNVQTSGEEVEWRAVMSLRRRSCGEGVVAVVPELEEARPTTRASRRAGGGTRA
jgi:hypothetical protein